MIVRVHFHATAEANRFDANYLYNYMIQNKWSNAPYRDVRLKDNQTLTSITDMLVNRSPFMVYQVSIPKI